MNPDLASLHPYPFQRLRALLEGLSPPDNLRPIRLSIGEPQHPTPEWIATELLSRREGLNHYAATGGSSTLRETICNWLVTRFGLAPSTLDPERHILPVNGTREGLFALAQAVVDRDRDPVVAMPNPFYQIYEGAALLAGAQPLYLNPGADGAEPDINAIDPATWQRCQLVYLCSPSNPGGAVLPIDFHRRLLALADRHDFVIASDECYSELYHDESTPPPGLLEACSELGRADYHRCVVFHSLSKRSSAPGLRSGFVAGDAAIIEPFLLYRTYHGCAMPLHTQAASALAWADESHVRDNRALYRDKFEAVGDILADVLPATPPAGGFYLWPDIGDDDERFARELYRAEAVTVLPGRYLSRPVDGADPGRGRVRIALVADRDDCIEAARRIHRFLS